MPRADLAFWIIWACLAGLSATAFVVGVRDLDAVRVEAGAAGRVGR